jgi:hypothetical protein
MSPPDAFRDGPVTQFHRMAAEMRYLLERLLAQPDRPGVARADLVAEHAWWTERDDRPLAEAVQRGFQARQLFLRTADADGTWRNSVSYIGDTDPRDKAVCTYDYDRAEIRFEPTSPLARPYPWPIGADRAVDAWYTRTGMAAITAWLLAVARLAAERNRRHVVLTNRLYHESKVLFAAMRLSDVEVHTYDDVDQILAAAAAEHDPVVVFLDSSRPDGDVAAVRRVLRESAPGQVGCVVWDNTCAPMADRPYDVTDDGADLDRTLLLVRSHVKLDQLALEFCALGSIAMISSADDGPEPAVWVDALRRFVPDCLAVTGGCASPATLRLLDALGLPNHELTTPSNHLLRDANRLAGRLLTDALDGHYRVELNDHLCFVEIHILGLAAPADSNSTAPWPPWEGFDQMLTRLEGAAAAESLPVWKSASFGFHYTGLSWYGAEEGGHTVLRVCFGMHDQEVTERLVALVVEHLGTEPAWA